MTKAITGKNNKQTILPLKINNGNAITNQEKADIFANMLEKTPKPDPPSIKYRHYLTNTATNSSITSETEEKKTSQWSQKKI